MPGKTVLIVDDESHIVNVLSLKLKNARYEVITASNGEEAFEQMERHMPDMMITDFCMPVMNVVDLINRLRSNEATKELPVILLTGRGQKVEDGDSGDQPKVERIMSKPFSPREILEQVEELVGAPS